MDHVDSAALNRYVTGVKPLAVLSLLLVVALYMLGAALQNSEMFGHLYASLLVINVLGLVLLLTLILVNVYRLVAQYRARVMGSRLTLRLLGMFVLLAVLPVAVVYFFSIQALHKGIDTWFDVRIEQALNDAMTLGRASLDAVKDDLAQKTRSMALELEDRPDKGLVAALSELQDHYGLSEVTLFAADGKIIASSGPAVLGARSLVPDRPSEALLAQVRQGLMHAAIDPAGKTGLQIRVLAPVHSRAAGASIRILQVLQQLPARYSKLGQSVQETFGEYQKLVYLREPLKFGFSLTLSLVALLTLLIAVWAAMFSARRLVTPLRDLAEGTQAVAQGNYRKQLPVPGNDELGILVTSFNDMTRRVFRAQNQLKRSQLEAETQRTYLETVLTHLSSGVVSFDARQRLRTHNVTADQILGTELERGDGRSLRWIAETYPPLAPFVEAIEAGFNQGRGEWQAEISVLGPAGRRVLIVRGTLLPGLTGKHGGYVVVFDDVTALIQAQRDAAWGEVARRLAHEIKNPLTPIQLSAERIRQKCMDQLPTAERNTLDSATRTIVQQVEALKAMVNAFSDYARPAPMQVQAVDLNLLIRDVVELYKGRHNPVRMQLDLDTGLPMLTADPGRLRQVMHNLVLNAADALVMTEQPTLYIDTRRVLEHERVYIELTVRDNGPGFAASVMERLFEPYVTTKEQGTGVGLAIVKKVIEEHGGQLRAENLAAGGACITIRLPVGAEAQTGEPAGELKEKSA
jgi:nitrogen fixation/metabolism regulation signal transduction histidine kinase